MKRTWVEVSLARLKHNLDVICGACGSVPVIAVVKANGYGHGMRAVAITLFEAGVRSFAVADLGEARELRSWVPSGDILVFGGCEPGDEAQFLALSLTSALYREDAVPVGVPVEIKIDTGMGRLGIAADRCRWLAGRLGSQVSGVFSTLSSADFDPAFTAEQIARFRGATEGLAVGRRHLSNSAGLAIPSARFDAVRPGLALYGIANADPLKALRPILRWKASVLAVNHYPAGATVGYGHAFTTVRPSRIAVLAVGYADGYSRRHSSNGQVLTQWGFAPVAGRVSMDLTSIDVTEFPDLKPGDEVVLLDDDPASPISAAGLARRIETIPYEILTSIGQRVERTYSRR